MLMVKGFLLNAIACLIITVMLIGCGSSVAKDVEYKNNMYNDGVVLVENLDNSWSMMNEKGEELANYKLINYMYGSGLVAVSNGDGFGYNGYINTKGEEVIPLIYSDAKIFTEGLAGVNIKGKYGFVDRHGVLITKPNFKKDILNSDGLIRAIAGGKLGYINSAGKLKIETDYDNIQDFSDGMAAVKKDNKWGFIDTRGKEVIAPKYEYSYMFNDGVATIYEDSDCYIIDKKGNEILEKDYYKLGFIMDNKIAMQLENELVGYMDKTEKIVIEPKYDDAYDFYKGKAVVEIDGKFGYIDEHGKDITDIVYDMIVTNRDGKIVAYKEENWECLDGRDAPNNIYMDYDRYDNIGIKQVFVDSTYNYQVKKELVGPFDLVYDDELRGYFVADNFFTDDGYMTLIYNYKYGLVNIDRGEVLNIKYRDIKPLFDKNALFALLKK